MGDEVGGPEVHKHGHLVPDAVLELIELRHHLGGEVC
jgi:hypothetical protein